MWQIYLILDFRTILRGSKNSEKSPKNSYKLANFQKLKVSFSKDLSYCLLSGLFLSYFTEAQRDLLLYNKTFKRMVLAKEDRLRVWLGFCPRPHVLCQVVVICPNTLGHLIRPVSIYRLRAAHSVVHHDVKLLSHSLCKNYLSVPSPN